MWRPEALSALGHWFPSVLEDLATIFDATELTGQWPPPMFAACTSLIPKNATLSDRRLPTFGPSSFCLAFIVAMRWPQEWVGNVFYGCLRARHSEQLAMRIAKVLEASAYGGDAHVGVRGGGGGGGGHL